MSLKSVWRVRKTLVLTTRSHPQPASFRIVVIFSMICLICAGKLPAAIFPDGSKAGMPEMKTNFPTFTARESGTSPLKLPCGAICCRGIDTMRLFRLDLRGANDGPPFINLSRLERTEPLGALQPGRWNFQSHFLLQSRAHGRIGQRVDCRGIEPCNHIVPRSLGAQKPNQADT